MTRLAGRGRFKMAPLLFWALLLSSIKWTSQQQQQQQHQQQQQQQQQQNVTYSQDAPSSLTSTVKPNYLETSRQITNILDRFMNSGYDKRVRPNYGGPPVEVNVTMRILSISSVSEVMMDFTADFYFRQTWHDPRLAFRRLENIKTLYVGAEVSKKIWLPDTFFGNEKLAYFHEATTPNVFLRIDHSGEVYRSIRLTVTSSCPMNLQYFPMDRQRCTIEAESYGYNVKDIIYRWARKDTAVERDKEISLPQFDIVKTVQKYRLEELSSGTYSRLIAEIHFARRMGYYLIQIYIPSSLIVVISWVSFWLHRNASPARVQLGVTTVLTMTTLMSSTNAALPKISYVKSIDIFLGTCFVMVFAALLEYATVGYLGKRIAMRKAQAQHAQSQAQARVFAQLQAQGAQGDLVAPVMSASMPLTLPLATGVTGQPAEVSPLVLGTPNIFASSTIQQQAAELAPLIPAGPPQPPPPPPQPPAGPISFLHQPQPATEWPALSAGGGCPHGHQHDHQHLAAHQHDHGHKCNGHLPPRPPARRHTKTYCQCSPGSSQTLPRNITFAGHLNADSHHHNHQQLHCCPCQQQQQHLYNQHHNHHHHHHHHHQHQQQHQTNTCCLSYQNQQQQQQHLTDRCPLQAGQEHPATPQTSGGSKGVQAAATAAAATFVNLHRKNKGLPPSSNPNFAQFAALASPYNRHLETIFGIRPSDIDKYSRVVFPVCFVCFQLMYWIVYLHISAFLETELQQQK